MTRRPALLALAAALMAGAAAWTSATALRGPAPIAAPITACAVTVDMPPEPRPLVGGLAP